MQCNWILFLIPIFLLACKKEDKSSTDQLGLKLLESSSEETTQALAKIITRQAFNQEIYTQGLVKSKAKVELDFDQDGLITDINIEVGSRVRAGQIIAKIEDFTYQNKLKEIQNKIALAKHELKAKLVSLGYRPDSGDTIPKNILAAATLESGLPGLQIEKELAQYQLEKTKLKSPISGVVIEVGATQGNPSSKAEFIAKIVDDRQLEVQFLILESELSNIRLGQAIEVRPLLRSGQKVKGSISKITAQIQKEGTILVYGKLNRTSQPLLDGMKVEVVIQDKIPQQLIIPKTAVLDRQEKLVVFTYEGGKAIWNYVEILHENKESYTVTDGLHAGDTIIINQNFNLSHQEPVEITLVSNE
jgi:multidrug efflux pump subunit AcrA (membrane-fusion protein)